MSELPDIQHSDFPIVPMYIHQVGVDKVKVPFMLESMYGGFHNLVASVTMTTDLEKNKKGISMSMLLRTLKNYLDQPLKHNLIKKILEEFKTAVETNSNHSQLKFEFQLPIYKKSPKSNIVFPQYYECAFDGRLDRNNFRFFQKIKVYYASYCPCSHSLCNHLLENGSKGFPHAQRCNANLLVEIKPENTVWLETLIDIVEKSVTNIPYPILRRIDEQEIARIAAENPQFVEDSIRFISKSLNEHDEIYDWIVKCTHEESIHVSNAIAISWKGIAGGFEGTYYL